MVGVNMHARVKHTEGACVRVYALVQCVFAGGMCMHACTYRTPVFALLCATMLAILVM